MKRWIPFVLFAGAALAQGPALDKAALEAYLRHMELWIPQVQVHIDDPKPSPYLKGYSEVLVHLSYNGQGKEERYFISDDGASLIKGEGFDLRRSPFQANLDRVTTANQPSFGGPATAPVTLMVFADFQCPYCKAEAEILRKNVVATFGDRVRVYFKDYPLESIHPWARAAAVAGRCVYRQSEAQFWSFHDWIYGAQTEMTAENLKDKVTAWVKENGLDAARFAQCFDAKETDAEVAANLAEGRALGINATPTTLLNGRKLEGTVQWELMEQLIRLELEHVAAAKK
jgi:protein-disulfide isomerase